MSHHVSANSSTNQPWPPVTTTVTGNAVPSFVTHPHERTTVTTTSSQDGYTTVQTTEKHSTTTYPTATTTTSGPVYSTAYQTQDQASSYASHQGVTYPTFSGASHESTTHMTTTQAPVSTSYQHEGMMVGESQSRTASGGKILRRVTGQERLVSVMERVDESRSHVVNERMEEKSIRIPKRIVREERIDRVIIVPETRLVSDRVEDIVKVQEKIVEVAKPIIREKIIEVPEIVEIEVIDERPVVHKKTVPKTVEVPEVHYNIVYKDVPRVVQKTREVPEITYRDVRVEKIVEIPEIVEEVVQKPVEVVQYNEKIRKISREVPVHIDVERKLPVPIEAEVTYEYRIPQLKPRYSKVTYPVYLPRFIEVPVCSELLKPELNAQAERYLANVSTLSKSKASLCEIENLAANIKKTDFKTQLDNVDLSTALIESWQTGQLVESGGSYSAGGYTGVGGGYTTAQPYTTTEPYQGQGYMTQQTTTGGAPTYMTREVQQTTAGGPPYVTREAQQTTTTHVIHPVAAM